MTFGKLPFKRALATILAAGMVMINFPQVLFAQSVGGAEKAKIAVWDFTLEGMQPGDGRAVTNRLRSELVNSGKYRVMTRDQIKTLLGEQALGQTLIDAKEAIKAGKLKGVQFVVTGTIVSVRSAFQITAEMIDGESAEIIKSITPGTYRGNFLDFLDNEIPRLAAQMMGETPPPAVAATPPPLIPRVIQTQPDQQPPPEPASGGGNVYYGFGVGSLIAAGVFQIVALAVASGAETDADEATTSEEYQTALDDRDSAEGLQGVAIIFGALGAVLLVIGATRDSTAAYGPGAVPEGFSVDVQPRSVMAGYALRW